MEVATAARRSFIPRKEHKKSRGACLSCKRRKVKCSETRPSCDLCSGRDLICEYPLPQRSQRAQNGHKNASMESHLLHPIPTSFTMSDLRLFHHFLLHASPHHPIGNETVWVQDIPALAHHYDFLMHAMLALAASNLTAISSGDFSGAAISHRTHAVHSLKGVIGTQITSASDADAMLAAFYTLGFQALYIDDGLIDFLVMIRGCTLVTGQIMSEGLLTVFRFSGLDGYVNGVETEEANFPCMNPESAICAIASLDALKPLCKHHVELLTLTLLENIVMHVQNSSSQAYSHFTALYAAIASLSTNDFLYFTDPGNKTMQMILGHFVAVHVLAGPFIVQEGFRSKKTMGVQRTGKWLDAIVESVGLEQQRFLEWPLAVVRPDALASLGGLGSDFTEWVA